MTQSAAAWTTGNGAGALKRKTAGIEMDYAGLQQRLDNIDRCLDRIERRLELVDSTATPAS